MKTNKRIHKSLRNVEALASTSKIGRFFHNPPRYIYAILYREILYKILKKEKEVDCPLFFDASLSVLLPAGTDIYLTGGKCHNLEVKLSSYLIDTLKTGDNFIDIGAHYGYYAMLASQLIGTYGKSVALEASPESFSILDKNAKRKNNIDSYHVAASNKRTVISYYEFPNSYSKYNTTNPSIYENKPWYIYNVPSEIETETIVLDTFLEAKKYTPQIIKISAIGDEYLILDGAKGYLKNHATIVIINYVSDKYFNHSYEKVESLLESLGYAPFVLSSDGLCTEVHDIKEYLAQNQLLSDHVIYKAKNI